MDTDTTTPTHNYSQNSWEGRNYKANRDLGITDIAKLVRTELKRKYPECTFSITTEKYSMGRSMTVALMATPFEVFDRSHTQDKNGNIYTERDYGHAQLNQYSFQKNEDGYNNGHYLTAKGAEVLEYAYRFANSFNYDDSDIMTDYFSVSYYLHLAVGRWDKPFTVKGV